MYHLKIIGLKPIEKHLKAIMNFHANSEDKTKKRRPLIGMAMNMTIKNIVTFKIKILFYSTGKISMESCKRSSIRLKIAVSACRPKQAMSASNCHCFILDYLARKVFKKKTPNPKYFH